MLDERVIKSIVSLEDGGDLEKGEESKVGVNLDVVGNLPEKLSVGEENIVGVRFRRYVVNGG